MISFIGCLLCIADISSIVFSLNSSKCLIILSPSHGCDLIAFLIAEVFSFLPIKITLCVPQPVLYSEF